LNFDEIGRLGGPRSPNQHAHDRAFSGIDTPGPPIQVVRPKLRLMFSTLMKLPCNSTTLHRYFCSLKQQDLKFMNLVSVFDQGVGKSRKTNVSESFIMAVIQYIYIYIYNQYFLETQGWEQQTTV
jgi:hypothetical protein